jgi:hypothetical protein
MAGDPTLRVKLESPLPGSLPAGKATAIFCAGVCYDRTGAHVDIELLLDGARHRPGATAMPRPDVLAAEGNPHSYRSGWWMTLPIHAPDAPGAIEISAAVRRGGDPETLVELGTIPVGAPEARASMPGVTAETIAICMATYNPDPELFAVQVRSLQDQSDSRWICMISDDCSDEPQLERIRATVGDDTRFVISRSDRRLGFYRNFERALRLVPQGVELIALCDQDDRWHPDKLKTLRAAIGDAQMVYSDQRLVDSRGRTLRKTMWKGRSNNYTDIASMLVANTVTGAAALVHRRVAELALPFPDTPGLQFHDHWLGLVALASGEIAYVDRPLYDYVQHSGAVFGEVTAGRSRQRRSRGWRAAYFCGYLSRQVQAEALIARVGTSLAPAKHRALERYIAAERSPASFAWLVLRPLRRLAGRNETLGSELELARGVLWRWLIPICAKLDRMWHSRSCDASYPNPLDFEQTRLRRWRAQA